MERRVCGRGPGCFTNHGRVSGAGFGLPGLQVRYAAHRQSRNVADHDPLGLGLGLEDGTEFRPVLGPWPIEKLLALPVDGDRVVIALANINTNENIDGFMSLINANLPGFVSCNLVLDVLRRQRSRIFRYG